MIIMGKGCWWLMQWLTVAVDGYRIADLVARIAYRRDLQHDADFLVLDEVADEFVELHDSVLLNLCTTESQR